jgi:hypothetical protein
MRLASRLRRERLGCLREVAAKTLQERPRRIERIANRACLAKIKRQRIFNHHPNSSRPTCFSARAEGRSKGSCDEVDCRPGRFATAARWRVCRPQSEVQLQFCDDPQIAAVRDTMPMRMLAGSHAQVAWIKTAWHGVVLLQRLYLFDVTVVQQVAATSSLDGTCSTQNGLVSAQPVCALKRGWVMSSYARYCQDQATACAGRARLASSPEIAAYCRSLEFCWLRLVEQAQERSGALGHESGLAATLLPLRDQTATYPAEYEKRAGELIARGARSLHPILRQKKRTRPVR